MAIAPSPHIIFPSAWPWLLGPRRHRPERSGFGHRGQCRRPRSDLRAHGGHHPRPALGRTSEGFGEDPYLVSQIAGTLVRAYQGERLSAADSVMASVKHFALYGAVEGGRDYNVVDMSPQRMYQDYLPPYRAAVDAGAGGVMVALNTVNGVPASANRWLLRDLLRDDWGFRGLTISDHGAIDELLRRMAWLVMAARPRAWRSRPAST